MTLAARTSVRSLPFSSMDLTAQEDVDAETNSLMVWITTFTLFVLSPGVENPAAQAGIDCSFCASDTRLRRGPGQDRTALVV